MGGHVLLGSILRGAAPKSRQHREVSILSFLVVDLSVHIAGKGPADLVFGGIGNAQASRVSTFRSAFTAAAGSVRSFRTASARAASLRSQSRNCPRSTLREDVHYLAPHRERREPISLLLNHAKMEDCWSAVTSIAASPTVILM